jgi:two-component system chemotaxis response regulator CheY
MSSIDGIGLIQEVRQKPGNRFMPIIMLTSESQPEKKSAGKAAGASGWITKPFNLDQLLAVVRMVCSAWSVIGNDCHCAPPPFLLIVCIRSR